MKRLWLLSRVVVLLTMMSIGVGVRAQNDTSKYTKNSAYGNTWKRTIDRLALTIPSDTDANKVTGSIAILGDTFYIKTTFKWEKVHGGNGGNGLEFQFANQYFEDVPPVGGDAAVITTNNSDALRVGDVIYGLVNDYTGKVSTYSKVTTWPTGVAMTDARVDGFIYRKKGAEYFKLNYDQYGPDLFGAVHDGVHDDRQAIINAMKYVPREIDNGASTPGAYLFFSRGIYRCSDSIRVLRTTHFYGSGSYLASGTQIKFDSGHHGFELMYASTHAYDTLGHVITYDGVRGAGGTIFENMTITCVGGGTRPGIGIWSHCEFQLQNCAVVGWPSMGVFVVGNAAGATFKDKLKHIYVTNGGTTYYTSVPTVVLVPGPGGGTGAAAHAVLGGQLGHISITDSGAGYVDNPYVLIQETGAYSEANVQTRGYGAKGLALLGLNTASVTTGGTGYTVATVTITGSTGAYVANPAEVEAVVDNGHIVEIFVLNGGSGYDAGTGATVVITDVNGIGSGAVASAVIVGGVVVAVNVIDQGDNYTDVGVTVDITGNSLVRPNATATATVAGGAVTAITVTSPGSTYPNIDSVHITITGNGTGATASATDLKIVRVLITSRGRDYEEIPHVYLVGGRRNTGHSAEATPDSLMNYRVKRVAIDNQGLNYFTPPMVAIIGGGGTGARAMAMRWANENGNANRWKIRDSRIDNNQGYGAYITGSDVNAGGAYGSDFTANGQYGLIDNSFLGNLYIGLHSNGNGLGPYASYQNTSENMFLMCYAEGNQMPIVALPPAQFLGGIRGVVIKGGAYSSESNGDPLFTQQIGLLATTTGQLMNGTNILKFRNSSMEKGSDYTWHMDTTTDQWGDFYDDVTNHRIWTIQGPRTAQKFGRSETVPDSYYIDRFFLGPVRSTGRQLSMRGTFPPGKKPGQNVWAKGDFMINNIPETTGDTLTVGWVRLTNGSGDVWGTDWRAIVTRNNVGSQSVSNAEFATLDGINTGTTIQAQLDSKGTGSGSHTLSINTQTASYTLVLADSSAIVRMNVAGANTFTIPPFSSVAFSLGTQIVMNQTGAGQVTITPGAGVILNSAGGMLKTRTQYSAVTLIKTASPDTWLVMGDLSN